MCAVAQYNDISSKSDRGDIFIRAAAAQMCPEEDFIVVPPPVRLSLRVLCFPSSRAHIWLVPVPVLICVHQSPALCLQLISPQPCVINYLV